MMSQIFVVATEYCFKRTPTSVLKRLWEHAIIQFYHCRNRLLSSKYIYQISVFSAELHLNKQARISDRHHTSPVHRLTSDRILWCFVVFITWCKGLQWHMYRYILWENSVSKNSKWLIQKRRKFSFCGLVISPLKVPILAVLPEEI